MAVFKGPSAKNAAFDVTTDFRKLQKLILKSPEAFNKAFTVGAIAMLDWMTTGSRNSSKTPPIRFGVLRGSGSAFVGSKNVKVNPQDVRKGTKERPTPAKSYSAPKDVITWAFNTEYAAEMHEVKKNPGKFSLQAGDANPGNKWIEAHIEKDREDLIKTIGLRFKKEIGI